MNLYFERNMYCLEIAQRNHIGLAIRAFVRLEFHRWQHHTAIFDAKLNIIRLALRLQLAQPSLVLPSTA
jgi:putative transposase